MSEQLDLPVMRFGGRKGHTMIISPWAARLGLMILKPRDDGGKKEYSINMGVEDIKRFTDLVASVNSMQDGNQKTLILKKFDNGAFNAVASIAVGRTDDGVAYIELQYIPEGGSEENRTIRRIETICGGTLEASDREFSKQGSSNEGMQTLLWYLKEILPAALSQSAQPRRKFDK